jgi:hypothetical protein
MHKDTRAAYPNRKAGTTSGLLSKIRGTDWLLSWCALSLNAVLKIGESHSEFVRIEQQRLILANPHESRYGGLDENLQ